MTALEAVRMLQNIDEKLKGCLLDLQSIATAHPSHVTAEMVQQYGEAATMIGAARLQLQSDAGITATDNDQ